jgi:hypothetical protein
MDDEFSEVSTGLEDDDEPMGAFGWDLAGETTQRFTPDPRGKDAAGVFSFFREPAGPERTRSLC